MTDLIFILIVFAGLAAFIDGAERLLRDWFNS